MRKICDEEKNILQNIPSMRNFFELKCLVHHFRVINVYQCFSTFNTLFDEVDKDTASTIFFELLQRLKVTTYM